MILLLLWCADLGAPLTLVYTSRDRAIAVRDKISRAANGQGELTAWADDAGGEVQVRLRHLVALQIVVRKGESVDEKDR